MFNSKSFQLPRHTQYVNYNDDDEEDDDDASSQHQDSPL